MENPIKVVSLSALCAIPKGPGVRYLSISENTACSFSHSNISIMILVRLH